MIGQAIPLFQSGNLLTKEMLTAIRDYSFGFSELMVKGYGNGILKGCKINVTGNRLGISPGMIVYEENLYLLTLPLSEIYHPSEQLSIFKIRFKDEIRTQSFIYKELEVIITEDTTLLPQDIEICRFKLQKGSKLRLDYTSFEDRQTEYDTVNGTHGPFATYGGISLSPEITLDFARRLMQCINLTPLDLNFCMMALNTNGMALSGELVSTYLKNKLERDEDIRTPHEMYQQLAYILRNTQQNLGDNKMSGRRRSKIMVD